MSHYAKIENDLVTAVIVADENFITNLEGEWIQTSYNTQGNVHALGGTALRGNFAAVGYHYDRTNDVFYAQQPFPSWTLDTATWSWRAPVALPQDDRLYRWDEATQTWKTQE